MQQASSIIVIDDDPLIRLIVSKTLQTSGLNIREAASGEEGLRLFDEAGADAVLLDVMMPSGIDGYATCSVLRSRPEGEHVPVLMMTGLEDTESINRAYEVGATDFITKPLNVSLLTHRIRYLLKSSATTQQLLQSRRRLHQLAYFDDLTELPNRLFFQENLEKMVTQAHRAHSRLGVLFLDLDGFKRINDTLGHDVGDQVLQITGERLRKSIRSCDTLILPGLEQNGISLARLGGDEFTVMLSTIGSAEDAAIVAERIRINLSEPILLKEHELVTTTSIGIAIFPEDGNTAENLLKNADLAMYYAKRVGGDTHCYFSVKMQEIALRRLMLENHLRRCIERNELELYYQPQLDMNKKVFSGVEALLRWRNKELGWVSPAEFIPLAEETGLIIPIGEWVLRKACVQMQAWRSQGIPLTRIAVNVSSVQFLHRDFTSLVERILNETGLEAEVLELELTESALISDVDYVMEVLMRLKKIGIKLAIDDFGTGYSSLSRLKNFPIDRLKVDQTFVRNLEENINNTAITSAIIAMAGNMSMKVTAEGVESDFQMDFLRKMFCDEAQGFFLCEPLPGSQLEEFLNSQATN
jgi:diguanylate cyclase